MHKLAFLALPALLLATACARDLDSTSYTSSSTSGVVLQGVIVSVRAVRVSESDRLGGNTAGMVAGGVGGGVAGSAIGHGKGSALAAVGGVVVGAVAGAALEDAFSKSDGMEYLIRIERKNIEPYAPKEVGRRTKNRPSATAANDDKSEIISVVQGTDQVFTNGQKVYIIYADDRPRVVPRD